MASRKKRQKQSNERKQATNADALRRALDWVMKAGMFDNLKMHGNTKWKFSDLVVLAVFWVWSDKSSLVEAFKQARGLVLGIYSQAAVSSYQGLMLALKTWTADLLPILWCRFHELMASLDGKDWRIGVWVVIAMDGSRISMPRTVSNESRYCAPRKKKNRKKKQKKSRGLKKNYDPQPVGPQAWLTLLWHVGYRVPWSWKTGPSNSSERDHFREMLDWKYPENTLFCADAGFVGYDFWMAIDRGHKFLVRVGGNITLLKELGYYRKQDDGIVYCWPEQAAKRKQPPLVLRLWHFHDGRGDVYLVTNVTDTKLLPRKLASEIYSRRWGIELQFRSYKQTFNRGKLRCRTADCAEVELQWSLLGLTMVQLLAIKEQVHFHEPETNTSVAAVLRAVRETIANWRDVPPPDETLPLMLRQAITDNYTRHSSKKSRNYPRHKEKPSAKKPIIINATAKHKKQLTQIRLTTAA